MDVTHLPSDDEARSLYLGLKRRGYPNTQRVKLSSNIENVELQGEWVKAPNGEGILDLSKVDIRDVHVPEHVIAAYRDLFRTPVEIMLDTPVFPADALPAFQPQCPYQVSCPPWQEAVLERLPMFFNTVHECGCAERWDEIDEADCVTAQPRYAYMLIKCSEHAAKDPMLNAVVDDPQG
jgi:hypothetical protein